MVGLCNVIPAHAIAPTKARMSSVVYAKQLVNPHQFQCLRDLWIRESHWNHLAKNKVPVYQVRNGKRVALHAFGIAQLLGETSRNPLTQVNKGLRYISHRHKTPCKAWAFWKKHNWY